MENSEKIQEILNQYPDASRDALIPVLQKVQEVCGFLSRESMIQIGEHLGLPTSKIYGVATFYNQFRFSPLGKHHIQVCRGTACHVKGSQGVFDRFTRELNVADGETTKDGQFSIEVVSCIGACGLAPVISVNGEFHARIAEGDVSKVVKACKKKDDGGKA